MRRVFVDTGGFFALLVPEDATHQPAADLFRRANSEAWQLVTTNAVVIETYSLLLVRTREGRHRAIEFLDRLDRTQCRVERIRVTDEKRAIALVRAHEDKTYSLCDALSFVVMERRASRKQSRSIATSARTGASPFCSARPAREVSTVRPVGLAASTHCVRRTTRSRQPRRVAPWPGSRVRRAPGARR